MVAHLCGVVVEGCARAALVDLARGTFRYLAPPEAALEPFLRGGGSVEAVAARAASAGLWFSRAFIDEVRGRVGVAAAGHDPALAGLLSPPPRPRDSRIRTCAAGFAIDRGAVPPLPPAPGGAEAIAIPAGRAWGDGTHPTTAMALEFLRREAARARAFIDIGCGSGILLVAAARLGIARRAGVEVDAVARREVAETLAAAGAPAAIVASLGGLEGAGPFDLGVLSIGFKVNLRLLPDAARAIRGRLLAGALREGEEERAFEDAALGAGLGCRTRLVCRSPPGPPGFGTWVGLVLGPGPVAGAAPDDVPVAQPVRVAPPAPEAAAPSGAARLTVLDPPLATRLLLEMPAERAAAAGLPPRIELRLEPDLVGPPAGA